MNKRHHDDGTLGVRYSWLDGMRRVWLYVDVVHFAYCDLTSQAQLAMFIYFRATPLYL